jgi:hypothetical protein
LLAFGGSPARLTSLSAVPKTNIAEFVCGRQLFSGATFVLVSVIDATAA